jgi:hypothetical protein
MFVRIDESGGRLCLHIVESCRNEAGKPRHRVVAIATVASMTRLAASSTP